ncbi:MAG: DnaJ domain-containing protein [Pseudomonadota bacterium]
MSQPVTIADASPERALARLALEGATGALEILQGKRRRRFFLRDGRLIQSSSNLKKEQVDQLPSGLVSGSQEQTAQHLAALRLAALLQEPFDAQQWQEGEAPPRELPCSLPLVLWEALDLALDADAILTRLLAVGDGEPACASEAIEALSPLGLPLEYRHWLLALDGFRSAEEVIQFGPGEPRACAAALYLAALYGLVSLSPQPAQPPGSEEQDELIDPAAEDEAWLDAHEEVASQPSPTFSNLSALIAASVQPREGAVLAPEDEPADEPFGEPDMDMEIDLGPEEGDLLSSGGDEEPGLGESAHEVSFARRDDDVELFDDEPFGDEPTDLPDPLAEAALTQIRAEITRIEAAENPFAVLGLDPLADLEIFRGAYFQLARQLHPDRLVGADEDLRSRSIAAFDLARAAWEQIKDDEQRQALIDRIVHGKKTEEEEIAEEVERILAVERLIDRGLAQFRAGRMVQAHELLAQARVDGAGIKDFKSADLDIYLGYLMWRVGQGRDEDEAERGLVMLQEALNEAQRHQDGWVLLGRVMKERGNLDEARKCFIKTLKINPENKDAFREMDRMKKEKEQADHQAKGFFARLFSRKKNGAREKKKGD